MKGERLTINDPSGEGSDSRVNQEISDNGWQRSLINWFMNMMTRAGRGSCRLRNIIWSFNVLCTFITRHVLRVNTPPAVYHTCPKTLQLWSTAINIAGYESTQARIWLKQNIFFEYN